MAKKNASENPELQEKQKKELEKRIEEERKRLDAACKRKFRKKNAGKKEKDKDKDLSDRVNSAKKPKEGLQKRMDYHRFLEAQMAKLDYSSMFSYLGSGINSVSYSYSEGDSSQINALQKKYETIGWHDINNVTNEEKMNHLMGLNRNFEASEKREAYKWWKAFNKGLGELLYQVSMT